MSGGDVSVVIVTWNVGEALARCLAALPTAWDDGGLPAPTWELIVVDNASTDETVALVREQALSLLQTGRGHPPQEVQV
ncbi:MAG: glycosyltransferase, partial [Anaerolineae bacterium]|nr:glycosyltransferase [Anaerolineae bacterium]